MAETRRKLRARAERRQYKDLPDEEIDDSIVSSFSLDEKLKCPRFGEINLVKEMNGEELNFKYFEKNGFEFPILVKEQSGLNMKVPNSKTFYVKDVERFVGPDRRLDVMDVKTQKNLEMTLKEWCDYFLSTTKKELLNVISLEFSHTELADKVEPPYVIKQLDWVNTVWPQFLKLQQKESTNAIEEMKYPKVQKYCLMSVKGCYTDFHIDFGGTSVWYHILRGKKIFWLIPPTQLNMELYEQWVLSGKQSHLFFGDTVEQCSRITLYGGQTFFIPSGWIHAVFTPEDSLVFGGNFLFSCAMESQIKIAQLETTTKVPTKYRYPKFNEIHYYVLANYLECLTGRCYLTMSNDGTLLISNQQTDEDKKEHYTQSKWNLKQKDVYLERYESSGLKLVLKYLNKLPRSKSVPGLITNATALLQDAKQVLSNSKQYEKPDTTSSTAHSVLYWLCKINYESYSPKPTISSQKLDNESANSSNNNLTSPLKSWGSNNTMDVKFIEYKNKLNSEAESNLKLKHATQFASANNQPNEIPNSFEKLIAATDINQSNKKQGTKQSSTNVIINSTISSSAMPISTVNNVYLTHPNSGSMVRPATTVVPTVTNMNIYPNNPNLIMNRPIFNGPILQPGIICANPTTPGLQPNLYASMQPGMNSFNYNLIGNTQMLLTTQQQIDPTNQLIDKNQQMNNKFGSSWLQHPTSIQQQMPISAQQPTSFTKQTNINNPTLATSTFKNQFQQRPAPIDKSSLSSSKLNSKQHPSNNSSPSINQPMPLNHPHSTGSTIIPQLGPQSIPPNHTYHQASPFLSANKPPVNNTMFNLAPNDPNRPSNHQSQVINTNSVINFGGQPGFIAPTLNPLNQNFIIAPVTSNIISNPIYPNFIGNVGVIPSNMLVQTNPHSSSIQQPQANIPTISQESNVIIGKPTIKLQRMNCRKCKTCIRDSCKMCTPCRSYFQKFGHYPPANNISYSGQISSEICLAKKCLNPILPYAAVCCACGKSGWQNVMINSPDQQQIMQLDSKCNLLECDTCNQIVHLDCVRANLPLSAVGKSNEGRMNSHLANSWTCPVCVPIKDKEEKNKLDSSLGKNKPAVSTGNRHELNQSQQHKAIVNKVESNDKSDHKHRQQSDQQTNKTLSRDHSKSFDTKSASSLKNYSNNSSDQSGANCGNSGSIGKEVYDFDDELDEHPAKIAKLDKQKNDTFPSKNTNNKKTSSSISKKATDGDQQSSNIKLPPKKMVKSKLSEQDGHNFESEDKLLLLATTSCQKSSIEKFSSKQLEQSKSNKQTSDKKLAVGIDDSKKNLLSNKSKLVTPTSPQNVQLALNSAGASSKSRNKQMQSVRGRLEQQLKFLKKKSDSKSLTAYRKFSAPKSSTSTNLTSTVSNTVQQSSTSQTTSTINITNVTKDPPVSNCLKNDCILYPNNNKDKDKDALLNKFKNLSSVSIDRSTDTSFCKEDSDSFGKLEIDTNLDSLTKTSEKSKESPKTSSKNKSIEPDKDSSLSSPSNKNLYDCDLNVVKSLPMSYSIEKLASSTSIINKPLEPAPPSTFSTFESGLANDSNSSKFGDKKQNDLFPNLNRFSSGFSNWSNAFAKQNQEKQSSPGFNYSSNSSSVFGAFSRNIAPTTPTFGSTLFGFNSPIKSVQDAEKSDKKIANPNLEKEYNTSTEDEADEKLKSQSNKEDDETDVETDIDEEIQRVIDEQLMSDDEDEETRTPPKSNVKKRGKVTKSGPKARTITKTSAGKKSTVKQTAPSKTTKSVKKAKKTSTSTSKKSKAVQIESEEEREEDQSFEDEIITLSKITEKGRGIEKSVQGKRELSPTSSKNKGSFNVSRSTKKASTKQINKKSQSVKPAQSKSASKKSPKGKPKTSASETIKQRKSEIEKLLDQSSDTPTDFMFNDDVYETIADKVKRSLGGRKSKIIAAAAVSALSLPSKQFESLITSTPKQTNSTKTSAKKSNVKTQSAKGSNSKKKTLKLTKQNASKDDETDLDSDETDNEVVEEVKKPTSRSGSANKKRKIKSAGTSISPTKRKSGKK